MPERLTKEDLRKAREAIDALSLGATEIAPLPAHIVAAFRVDRMSGMALSTVAKLKASDLESVSIGKEDGKAVHGE